MRSLPPAGDGWGYARYRWQEDGLARRRQASRWWLGKRLPEKLDLPALMVGEIGSAGREALHGLYGRLEIPAPARHLRRAGYLADIAWQRLRNNQVDAPTALLPLYAR